MSNHNVSWHHSCEAKNAFLNPKIFEQLDPKVLPPAITNLSTSCQKVDLLPSNQACYFYRDMCFPVNHLVWFVPNVRVFPQIAAKTSSNLSDSDVSRMLHIIFEDQ